MLPVNSISAATTTSYPPPPERMEQIVHVLGNQMMNPYTGQPIPAQSVQLYQQMPNTYRQGMQTPMSMPMTPGGMTPGGYPPQPGMPTYSPAQAQFPPVMPIQPQPLSASGMFTRNLIGSLNVNAFRLTDPDGKVGFWFVLQDLSVRTEGSFRYEIDSPVFCCVLRYQSYANCHILQTENELLRRWEREWRYRQQRNLPCSR